MTVAPLTGAWIETLVALALRVRVVVAPLTGAWIETFEAFQMYYDKLSHPSRVRGLKLLILSIL